ncbi:MAG: hypothetical protein ACRDTQ_05835 [Micromonosporaceae bacterium]
MTRATHWPEREAALVRAYGWVAERHNELALTDPLDPRPRPYFDRPYLTIEGGRYAEALRARIDDPWLRALPSHGGVDQWVDSTEILTNPRRARPVMAALLRQTPGASSPDHHLSRESTAPGCAGVEPRPNER